MILASQESEDFAFEGIADALALGAPGNAVDLRIFAKPEDPQKSPHGRGARPRLQTVEDAIERAKAAAARVRIRYSA